MEQFRLTTGASEPRKVDPKVAEYRGTVRQVVERIIKEEIRDPALLDLLHDDTAVLFATGVDQHGNTHEVNLQLHEDWRTVLGRLRHERARLEQVHVQMGRAVVGGAL